MIQKIYLLILGFVLLVLLSCENKEPAYIIYNRTYASAIDQARTDFAFYMTSNHIPGANIAIARNNEIIYSEGMGTASKDLDVPLTRKNILRIGEVSQLFTHIIYWKLVEEGVLHPDSAVQHYIPDYPATDFKLAIKHLPFHTSGIRQENPTEVEEPKTNVSIQKGLEDFMNDPLNEAPGWQEEMSMFNTNLLGAVMEKATNKRFEILLKEYITEPLQLTNTAIDHPFSTVKGRVDFFDQNMMAQIYNAPFRDLRYTAPAKGILSNAEDLVKLGMALVESDYFNEEFRKNMFTPVPLFSGYNTTLANGWMPMQDDQGRTMYGISGSVTGGGAALLIYPDEKLVIAGSMNLTLGISSFPLIKIANYFLN